MPHKKYTNWWPSISFKDENASSARVDSLPPGTLVTIASWESQTRSSRRCIHIHIRHGNIIKFTNYKLTGHVKCLLFLFLKRGCLSSAISSILAVP